MLKHLFRKKTNNVKETRDYVIYCYISKKIDCSLCVYKENEFGFGTLSKLQSTHLSTDFKEISKEVFNYIELIRQDPLIDSKNKEGKEAFANILNGRSYKRFCEENLLIYISYDLKTKSFCLNNCPKDTKQTGYLFSSGLEDKYSTKYICHNQQEIQQAIEKAYEEGLAYLEAIGEPLKEPTDKGRSDNNTTNNKDIILDVPIYKNTWICLKNDDDGFNRLISDINNINKTTYNNALKASREDKIMITGLYDGYFYISGYNLPSNDRVDEVKDLLNRLSDYSDEIAYYCSHRTVDLFGFAYMNNKQLLRLYSYCESILANIGAKLPVEDKLDINLVDTDDHLFVEGYDLLNEDILTDISYNLSSPIQDLVGRKQEDSYVVDVKDILQI